MTESVSWDLSGTGDSRYRSRISPVLVNLFQVSTFYPGVFTRGRFEIHSSSTSDISVLNTSSTSEVTVLNKRSPFSTFRSIIRLCVYLRVLLDSTSIHGIFTTWPLGTLVRPTSAGESNHCQTTVTSRLPIETLPRLRTSCLKVRLPWRLFLYLNLRPQGTCLITGHTDLVSLVFPLMVLLYSFVLGWWYQCWLMCFRTNTFYPGVVTQGRFEAHSSSASDVSMLKTSCQDACEVLCPH